MEIINKLRKITPIVCCKCKEIVKDYLVDKLKTDETLRIIKEWDDLTGSCSCCKDCIAVLENLLIKARVEEKEDEYQQEEIIHCPVSNCKGMLLTSPYKHELKCSDCNKYFMEIIKYKEVSR